jgi:hypothetical protein
MQLVLIALIGVGVAGVVGLFGPLAISAGRAFQRRFGSVESDHHHPVAVGEPRRARL